jgi:hypothetical protein
VNPVALKARMMRCLSGFIHNGQQAANGSLHIGGIPLSVFSVPAMPNAESGYNQGK